MRYTFTSLVLICCLFLSSITSKAQSLQSYPVSLINDLNSSAPLTFTNLSNGLGKTGSCGVDTINYPFNKTSAFNAVSLNNATSGNIFAQWYPAEGAMTVSGFEFFAWMSAGTNATVTLNCRIYTAGPDSMPTGLPLATTSIVVDSTFGGGLLSVLRKSAVFPVPVTTSSAYVLTVESSSATNVSVISNSWTANPPNGRSEWLSSVKIQNNFIRSYNVNIAAVTFNADFIFQPYVSYSLTAGFSTTSCINGTNVLTFTNTSSSVLFSKYYSVRAFQGIPQLSCLWNYGDTSGTWYAVDGSHFYQYKVPHTVTLKDTLYGWRIGCSDSYSQLIEVAPDAPGASNNGPLCIGATMRLYADTIPGATYYWTGPGGFTSTQQNPQVPGAGIGSMGNYSVVSIIGQCTSEVSTTYVNVISSPVASSNSPVCAGQALNLSSTTINGAVYSWTGPNGFTSSVANPSIPSATTADSGVYQVTITLAGCGTIGPLVIGAAVNRIPGTPVVGSNSPLCVGDNLNLTANSYPGGVYSWAGPNSFFSNQQNPTRAGVAASFAGTYNVVITSNGCSSNPGSVTVTINNVPNAPVVGNNGPLCAGQSLSLTASTIAGATYSWSGPNGFTSTAQNPTRTSLTTLDAGNYSVIATVNGCPSVAANTNVVITSVTPTPAVTSNGPLCPGQNLQLSASNIAGATYSWTGPNGFTSSQQNPVINAVTIADAGIYSVTATTVSCGTSSQGNISIVINSLPAAPTAGNNGPLCDGATLNLSASNITGATYNWTGPNGFTSTDQNPVIVNVNGAKSGEYSVYVTVPGCGTSSVSTTLVQANRIPQTPTATGSGSVCAGDSIKLFAIVSGTGPNVSYSWTGPDNFNSTLKNPVISNSNPAHAGFYSLTISDSGCVSATASTPISVKAIPAAPVPTSNAPICEGANLMLFASTVNGATYHWSGPDYNSNAQNPVIIKATDAASGTYNVISRVNGCMSIPATITVIVNSIPDQPVVSNSGPKCVGESVTLSASSIPGATYAWSGPNGYTSQLQNPVLTNVTLNESGDYSVIAITSTCSSEPATTTVAVNNFPPSPVLSSNPANGMACAGDSVQLFASFINGASYEWTGPAGFGSTTQSPVIRNSTVANSGVYTATVTKGGCVSPPVTLNITINPVPQTSEIDGVAESKEQETHTYTVTGPASSLYNWIAYGGGTILSGNNTTSVNVKWGAPNANAAIRVQETSAAGCKGVVKALFVNVTPNVGLDEQIGNYGSLSLFPNPADKMVTLNFDMKKPAEAKVEFVNVLGQTVLTGNKFVSGKEHFIFDVSELTSGIYFVSVSMGNEVKTMRLVVR